MRNWGALIGGVVAASALIVIGLAMVSGPRAPYLFLDGREPLKLTKKPLGLAPSGRIYTFKADYDGVLRAARAELVPAGHEEVAIPSSETPQTVFYDKSAWPTALPAVTITKDNRTAGPDLMIYP